MVNRKLSTDERTLLSEAWFIVLLLAALGLLVAIVPLNADAVDAERMPALLDLTVNDIDGKPVDLSKFEGKVIMIVNVASFCGLTKQYASLQKLYEQYKNKGFTILAFPANEFGQQEPGTNEEIKTFCHTHYKITFPIFSKIVVKGCGQHTLYKYLTSKTTNPRFGGEIEWNFAKFLINRKGEIVARFPANDDPLKPEVVEAIKDEIVRCR